MHALRPLPLQLAGTRGDESSLLAFPCAPPRSGSNYSISLRPRASSSWSRTALFLAPSGLSNPSSPSSPSSKKCRALNARRCACSPWRRYMPGPCPGRETARAREQPVELQEKKLLCCWRPVSPVCGCEWVFGRLKFPRISRGFYEKLSSLSSSRIHTGELF